ncbi:phage tail tape measure protein [Pseudomonas sp. LP_4_YM]|uniref:phage tail tape measure protein n=1 Tax=Pseudomonas sp. LP_4_YM TaxID=2485135 RepID=UPI00104F6D6E|nr:phage tail tape measure protein [Pseudomonas sp. LP_4_YM]TCT87613.1 lambda family phage tail tape measure protein [Pseudomonas sp. LP_4_YM]
MTQTSRLVLEIDSRDAEQKAADARKALEALESVGLRVKPAMDKVGSGIDGAGSSAESATKSFSSQRAEIEQLLGRINPLTRQLGELDRQEVELARHRKAGTIDADTFTEYQQRITSTRNDLTRFSDSLTRTGNTAKQTAAALRGVPAQFTDIAVSLQGGQAPLTVFLQQGGQLKDMFGGVAPAAKALGGYVAGLITPFTIAAAAVGAFTLAAYKGYEQAEQYRKALTLTGSAAGKTSDDLIALSGALAGGRNFSEASEAVLALAGNGRLVGEAFTEVARAATELSVATGKSASDIADQLSSTKGKVTDLAVEYSEKYGVITKAVFEQVKSLEEQGDRMGAIKVLAGTLAAEMGARNKEMIESTRGLSRAWDEVKSSMGGAWSELKAGLSASPEMFKLQHLQSQLQDAQKIGDAALISGLEKQVALAQQIVDSKTQAAEKTSAELQERKALVSADQKWLELSKKEMSDQAKLAKDIADARKLGVEAGRSQAEIDKVVGEIQSKYDKKQAKPKAITEDAGQKMLDQARQQYAVLQQQNSLLGQQGEGSKALGTEAKRLLELEQQIADLKEKKTLTAAQKQILAMADLNIAQQKQNAALERENQLKKISTEQTQKLLAFQENLNSQLTLAQSGLDQKLAGAGLGDKALQRLQEQQQIQQSYQSQMDRLTYDYNKSDKTTGTTDLYNKETEALRAALQQRLTMQQGYYAAVDQAQSDWSLGASSALQTYAEQANDVAGQTRNLFTNAFGNMEDAVVNFVKTGKLSFKDFADQVIADLIRIQVRQAAAGFLNMAISTGMQLYGGGANGFAAGSAAATSSRLGASAAGYSSAYGFSSGGYTGPGGVNEPAGIVHKGEVVWSQDDIKRAGGVQAVEGLRNGNVSPSRAATSAQSSSTRSDAQGSQGMPPIQQIITVEGSADEATLARIQQAARQGAIDGYNLVLRDFKQNGPARRMLRA